MFTGIIATTGEVIAFAAGDAANSGAGAGSATARLTVAAPRELVEALKTGDSVAVSGVCLTALQIEANTVPPRFSADLAAETLTRTTLSQLGPGAKVNLELPTPAGAPLGGHVVQGHVDGVGTVTALGPVRAGVESDWTLRVRLPRELMRYVVEKGSIAVEGISLTVAGTSGGAEGDEIWVAILPHTYSATNLHTLRAGDGVNIEVDVLAKYAEGRARGELERRELTVEYLLANGY